LNKEKIMASGNNSLKIINEYNLIDITKDISDIPNGISLISEMMLLEIPVFLRLYRSREFYYKFAIKISLTPYFKYYYVWPGDKSVFTKFLSIARSCQDSYYQQIDIFRKILEYLERNESKRNLTGKKYGLK